MSTITNLIEEVGLGKTNAADALFGRVYHELKLLAKMHMANEGVGHTLQPTALVNEVYLKLFEKKALKFNDKQHFFSITSRAMERILVDFARSKKSQKRGGRLKRNPLADSQSFSSEEVTCSEIIDLNEVLTEFEKLDPERCELVRLHVFSGQNLAECARILGISKSTAERRWRFARAWLVSRMSE